MKTRGRGVRYEKEGKEWVKKIGARKRKTHLRKIRRKCRVHTSPLYDRDIK